MNKVKVKVDEDLPERAKEIVQRAGYDCLNVRDQDLGGCEDGELWKIVQGENRFFVTGDKGFGDIGLYPPNSHGGILLVRPDDDGIEPIVELLGKVFSAYDLQDLRETITVVTSRGVRVRRM